MNDFLEILKYIVPAAIVLLACYLTMQKFMENEQNKIAAKLRADHQKISIPLRLQAYERVILLLERTTIQSMIRRLQKGDMDAKTLQALMIKSIRSELDHNLTQQTYVSTNAWNVVKRTVEENIKFINSVSQSMKKEAKSKEFALRLLNIISKAEQTPNDIAVGLIKKEVRKLF